MTELDNRVRFAHFHYDRTMPDGRLVKGSLAASIATKPLPNGSLAVGIARCNPIDQPTRFRGRMLAQARLNRYLRRLNGERNGTTAETQLDSDIQRRLVLTMTLDEFKRDVLSNPFKGNGCPFGAAEA